MESINPNDLLALFKNPIFILMSLWLFKEIWSSSKKRTLALDTTIKDLSDKLNTLTVAIVRLETKLDSLGKYAEAIPKLQSDVTAAHLKIRKLNGNA